MLRNKTTQKWIGVMVLLILANIVYYFYSNWGLITVKVKDAPLSKVISSIEWQGWVKIYTNIAPDSKVTMYVDHVPLAEAMESLAANVDVPAPPSDGTDNGGAPHGAPPGGNPPGNPPGGVAAYPPAGGPGATGGPGGPGSPGGGGRGGLGALFGGGGGGFGGGGGGGGGRQAQWNLAFFVAPTNAQVKQEISDFVTSDPNSDAKVYTYGTQIQLVATDDVTSAPDPRYQSWPGVQPPSATPAPAPAPANAVANGATPTPAGTGAADPTTDPPDNGPPTVQTYLQDLAQAANIWIMAPSTWSTEVSSPPPPNSSIIRAVENFVSASHGVMIEAIVLRAGRGGPRGNNRDFAANDNSWANRMRNAINGLPADEQAEALDQLNKEIDFRKNLQALPPEQRRQLMLQHFAERMLYGDSSRLSPEKRAKAFIRLIALRNAAKAPK